MHTAITKHFKNYHLFGFTGTPIFAENAFSSGNPHLRTTEQAFGDKLHTYTIVDAIRDGNVLPFRIDYIQTIKKKEDFPDEKVYNIYREGAYKDARRVDLVTNYILDRFDQKTKRQYGYKLKDKRVMGFNSIFATASIDMAKLYYTAFKRLQAKRGGEPLKVGLIYSFGVNEDDSGCGLPEENFDVDSLDTPDRDFLEGPSRTTTRCTRRTSPPRIGLRRVQQLLQGPLGAPEEPRDRPGHRGEHGSSRASMPPP